MPPSDDSDPAAPPAAPPAPPSGIAVPIRIPRRLADVRRRLDRAALAGARPHVTVLFPFLPASALTPDIRADLVGIAAAVEPFEVLFERVRRFDDGLVWLDPEPGVPFAALTDAVVACWPTHPPYGGRFDEVIPHLTVAEADSADAQGEAEAVARSVVPFRARATRLEVWRQDADGRWHPHWRIPLGGPVRP